MAFVVFVASRAVVSAVFLHLQLLHLPPVGGKRLVEKAVWALIYLAELDFYCLFWFPVLLCLGFGSGMPVLDGVCM